MPIMAKKTSDGIKYHSVLTNVPAEFVVEKGVGKDMQYFPRLGGYIHIANQMGHFKCVTEPVFNTPTKVIFKCSGYIIPNKETVEDYPECMWTEFLKPTVISGESSIDTLTGVQKKYMYLMAETRAIVRCLRMVTGMSYTAFEEIMPEEEFAKHAKNIETELNSVKNADKVVIKTAGELHTTATGIDRRAIRNDLNRIKAEDPEKAVIITEFMNAHKAVEYSHLKDADLSELHRTVVN